MAEVSTVTELRVGEMVTFEGHSVTLAKLSLSLVKPQGNMFDQRPTLLITCNPNSRTALSVDDWICNPDGFRVTKFSSFGSSEPKFVFIGHYCSQEVAEELMTDKSRLICTAGEKGDPKGSMLVTCGLKIVPVYKGDMFSHLTIQLMTLEQLIEEHTGK